MHGRKGFLLNGTNYRTGGTPVAVFPEEGLNAMTSETCIVFFIKHPESDRVKTRLAAALGNDFVRNLYRLFVADSLEMLEELPCDSLMACDPQSSLEQYTAWLGPGREYLLQSGNGLGERMSDAFVQAFTRGYSRVLLLGSDVPDLPYGVLERAFTVLSGGATVIGPSQDGGYYLIGFNKDAFTEEVFRGISWSTPTVFRETRSRLRAQRLTTHILPVWSDVDTKDDLAALYQRNRHTHFARSGTMQYLARHWEGTNGESRL